MFGALLKVFQAQVVMFLIVQTLPLPRSMYQKLQLVYTEIQSLGATSVQSFLLQMKMP